MNSLKRLYKALEEGIITVDEFETARRRAEQIRGIVSEKQPAKTKERITSGR